MNLKLLFFGLFYAALLIPAELKPDKPKKHERHEHQEHHERHDNHDRRENHDRRKKGRFEDIISDDFFKIRDPSDDDDDDDDSHSDWVFELQALEGKCIPNPCLNNGVCEQKGKRGFKCSCPKPFKGSKCQKGPKYCKKGLCGRGECVRIPTAPFYECKCKMPFQPPDCRTFSVCQPNPCRNGGQCVKDGNNFDCQCPLGFRGRFCHVGPNDCYVDDGESYRGNVSETDDGYECLHWNSHFILENGADPFKAFQDTDGLGPHNFCRNPDEDKMPWCFYRRGRRLLWDYCNVTKCLEPTGVAPTKIVPTDASPTASKAPPPTLQPTASATVPTKTEKPSQAPQPSTTSVPLIPTGTAPPQQFATCGRPLPQRPITRIFGGLKVAPGALPWQVSLQMRPKNSNLPFKHTCGGVLIKSCWVLTAGHCILKNMDMQVVMGDLSLNTKEPTEQTIKVAEAILHENYRETPTAVYNDIALLRLSGTDGVCANETQFVKTACLPDVQLPDGKECKIAGWGVTEDAQYGSNHLLDANVLLINQEKCTEPHVYGRILDNSMFCAGYLQGGADACQGDSGGPLTCQENNTNIIYGLVSWGDQCGQKNKPGVYTRVTRFLNWIRTKTQAASP
ncbi:hyaluronan-binding protein 2 [Perca flavescens]|uniref:hyaluronan-binding protein 2 n=1 Tax=Perca flavescens TaxID=8167 RepID=UPI00106E1F81|nr:hyaluronan-binding protein 2 [Perca flavescens]